jgi:hypothetical protein
MPVIALCGYAQSGKDTAAEALVARGWKRRAFADPIRELAWKINPIICENFTLRMLVGEHGWDKAKITYPRIRKYLQDIGQGVREIVGDGAWITASELRIWDSVEQGVVITDCRHPNEAEFVRSVFHGEVVRIQRPGNGPANSHISETAIDDISADYTIINDGTPEELQAKLVAYAGVSFQCRQLADEGS